MVNAIDSLARKRRPGPAPFFDEMKLSALAAYLAVPGSTIKGAAETFGCSVSLIEKVLTDLRKKSEQSPGEAA